AWGTQGGIAGAGGYAQRRVCLGKLLPDLWGAAVDRPADDGGGRSGGRAARGCDELPDLEGEVRLRSFVGWRELPDQWALVHRDRCGCAGILWSEAGGFGHAGFLAAVD